jgi:hypothetical protein
MNKLASTLLSLLLLLGAALPVVYSAEEEEEPHHSCACEAEELGFKIDCSDTATMLAALQVLQSSGCSTQCDSDVCIKSYFIVQSHHDYCPEEGVPVEIEDGFHDYDEVCEACEIIKMATEGAPDCPAAVCDDNSGNTAYAAAIEAGCLTNCTSDTCRDHFFILRSVHDSCPHDSLTEASELGLHDLEEACVEQVCNQAVDEDQLVCHEDDHGAESMNGGTGTNGGTSTNGDGGTSTNGGGSGAGVASMAMAAILCVSSMLI